MNKIKELNIEYAKPIKPTIRKSNIFEKLFRVHKLKYNAYVNELETNYEKEYNQWKAFAGEKGGDIGAFGDIRHVEII